MVCVQVKDMIGYKLENSSFVKKLVKILKKLNTQFNPLLTYILTYFPYTQFELFGLCQVVICN